VFRTASLVSSTECE